MIADDQCHAGGDEDSLFGSPPPSPARGRSPHLALPHGSGTQNVGTIAPPGSHNCSELPPNPIALLQCHAPELTSRPAAHYRRVYPPIPEPTGHDGPAPKRKKSKRKSSARPAPPVINLPDVATRPPPNFLRNQQALLGTAGLVGGVNPAKLCTSSGASVGNPIVVDDEYDPPPLGHGSRVSSSIDSAHLPTPSPDQVIGSLIKQKNIFPVLESIMKLAIAREAQNVPSLTAFDRRFRSRESQEQPSRKRRLTKVPAGAVDWDVPYPFLEGEGPQSYKTNWERERGRQLMAQLVGIIRSAAKKAATRTYLQQRKRKTDVEAVNTPSHHIGVPQAVSTPEVLTDASNDVIIPPTTCETHPDLTPYSHTLEELFASFFSDPPAASPTSWVDHSPSELATSDFDHSIQNWISMLESSPLFELPSDNSTLASSASTSRDSSSSPIPCHVTALPAHQSFIPSQLVLPLANGDTGTNLAHDMAGIAIDPMLLEISSDWGRSMASGVDLNPHAPTLSHSPMPSTSSLLDPLTPSWEGQSQDPEVYCGDQAVDDSMFRGESSSAQAASTSIPKSPIPSTVSSISSINPPLPAPRASHSRAPTMKAEDRQAILRKARERKRQLAAEIERAKVELWETTIEQGVLAQVAKELS